MGGDCDTLACMMGALLGAKHGLTLIHEPWRSQLEQHDAYGVPCALRLGKALATVDSTGGRDDLPRLRRCLEGRLGTAFKHT